MEESKTTFSGTFNGTFNENKFSKMKKLISAIETYVETRVDDKAILVNQYLQALSLSLDLSIFDPHTNIASNFFINLYDLMNILEPRSLTSWYCVDVLSNVCKNCAAREALIKNYNFLPCLAKLVGNQLTTEKKTRLLRLMQDLTCGIKISWQIPHITHLLSTLCKWIEQADTDIITLSLGVLVNLCYKNITSICTLQRNVDLKKFLRMCLAFRGPIVEVYVCQITIILEDVSGYVPAEVLPKLIGGTFNAVLEAYKNKDSILLKQVVLFFIESIKANNHNSPLNHYSQSGEAISTILDKIEATPQQSQDPECISIILDFIHFLIEYKASTLSSLYSRIISFALKWIQESTASYQALAVLKTIAVCVDKKENGILAGLSVGLPVFLLVLNSCKDEAFMLNTEYSRRLGALLQLLRAMIEVKSIRTKITGELQEEVLSRIFLPLLGDDSPRSNENTCSMDAVNLYVYALALIGELVKYDSNWIVFMNGLLQNKKIHIILAQAICQSPPDVKKIALDLSGSSCSIEVASALANIQAMVTTGKDTCNHATSQMSSSELSFCFIPANQRLDSLIDKVESNMKENKVLDISTSELMELYNHKVSYLAQAERAALSSVEAANKHCTHLQHRIARLTAQQTRLQQSEFNMTQKLEETLKKRDEMKLTQRDLQNKIEAEKGKSKAFHSQLKFKEKALGECEAQLEDTKNKLAETKVFIVKLEESSRRLEKNLKKSEEMLEKAHTTNENYSLQISDLEKCLLEKQKKLDETTSALQLKSSILESITKMAKSS